MKFSLKRITVYVAAVTISTTLCIGVAKAFDFPNKKESSNSVGKDSIIPSVSKDVMEKESISDYVTRVIKVDTFYKETSYGNQTDSHLDRVGFKGCFLMARGNNKNEMFAFNHVTSVSFEKNLNPDSNNITRVVFRLNNHTALFNVENFNAEKFEEEFTLRQFQCRSR